MITLTWETLVALGDTSIPVPVLVLVWVCPCVRATVIGDTDTGSSIHPDRYQLLQCPVCTGDVSVRSGLTVLPWWLYGTGPSGIDTDGI